MTNTNKIENNTSSREFARPVVDKVAAVGLLAWQRH